MFSLAAGNTGGAAQSSGVTYGGYTTIDYDEETNTVIAYSETSPEDYELMNVYQAQVTLTVTNEFGVVVASGTGEDNGYGIASVELTFAAEAGRTYTATGVHKALASLYSYDNEYPYRMFYWDNWFYTNYESQSIYNPWYYGFYRPNYEYFQRRNRTISLGRTYDSVSTTGIYRGSVQAQGSDINFGNRVVDLGDGVKGNKDTISWRWSQITPLSAEEGINALNLINSKLDPTQKDNRATAFPKAIDYINRCRAGGGCPSTNGSQSFYGKNNTRVDVVINAGTNFRY